MICRLASDSSTVLYCSLVSLVSHLHLSAAHGRDSSPSTIDQMGHLGVLARLLSALRPEDGRDMLFSRPRAMEELSAHGGTTEPLILWRSRIAFELRLRCGGLVKGTPKNLAQPSLKRGPDWILICNLSNYQKHIKTSSYQKHHISKRPTYS